MLVKFVYPEYKYCEIFNSNVNDTINDEESVMLKPDDRETAIKENMITNKSA